MLYGGWNLVQNGTLTGQWQWGVDFPDATTAKANGWFPDLAGTAPSFDAISQILTTTRTLQGDVVAVTYSVVQLDAATVTTNRAAAFQALGDAVQAHLDAVAEARGYRDIATAVTYLNSSNTTWKADATAANAWRDAVWTYVLGLQAPIAAGTAPMPAAAALIAELPAMTWPS